MTRALLHNMSARPRTQVRWRIEPVRLAVAAPDPCTIGFELPPNYVLNRSAEELQAAWTQYALTGAALVFPWRKMEAEEDGHKGDVTPASDLALTLNVLGRARGGVLSARAALVLEPGFLSRSLYSDDLRLVRLAARSG